jgi:hypothetical protein
MSHKGTKDTNKCSSSSKTKTTRKQNETADKHFYKILWRLHKNFDKVYTKLYKVHTTSSREKTFCTYYKSVLNVRNSSAE